jgi:hypothetical protein
MYHRPQCLHPTTDLSAVARTALPSLFTPGRFRPSRTLRVKPQATHMGCELEPVIACKADLVAGAFGDHPTQTRRKKRLAVAENQGLGSLSILLLTSSHD